MAGELLQILVIQRVCHGLQQIDRLALAVYQNDISRPLTVLLFVHHDGKWGTLVGPATHLVNVPVRVEQAQVADAYIRADALHFLGVPKREGVVVAIGEDDGVGRQ